MKRITYIVLITFFGFQLKGQKLKVVASASIFHDMAKEIGGHFIESTAIVPIGGDPHIYEPTPRDAQILQDADLILINGMTFEGWIREVIDNSGTKAKTILITDGVKAIASDRYNNAVDPHAWMDVNNGLIYIENIRKALTEADPKNAGAYLKNYRAYSAKLKTLDQYIFDQIETIPKEQRVLITSHDAFRYYGDRYGLELNAIMGISTEADVQTSDIQRVSKIIKEQNIPAVFLESTINPKMLKQIAEDNDVSIGGELFADSLGDKDSPASTYYSMLKHNTDTIVKGLRENNSKKKKAESDDSTSVYLTYGIIGLFMILILFFMIRKMNS